MSQDDHLTVQMNTAASNIGKCLTYALLEPRRLGHAPIPDSG